MTTHVLESSKPKIAPGSPVVAHLVAPDDCCVLPGCDSEGSLCGGIAVDGASKALQARIAGIPVQTLCGIALVPSQDPRDRATCPRCLLVLRDLTGADDDRDCREG